MKLRSQLLLLALATLIPMALFAAAVTVMLVERERDAFQRGAIERVRALLTAVDTELSGSATTLEALAVLPAFDRGDLEGFRHEAERIVGTQRGWLNIVVTNPAGEHLMNLLVPPGKPLPASQDMETARRAAQTRRSVIGNLVPGAVLRDRRIFTVRTPVVRDGEVKYVLAAAIDPEPFRRLLERQAFPGNWLAAVIDGNYRFVARTPAPPDRAEYVTPALRAALASRTEGWQGGRTLEGMDALRAYARSSYSGWSVSMALPSRAYFRSGWQAALLIGAGALFAIGAGVGLAFLLARRITRPIASLAAAAPMLGQGEAIAAPGGEKVVDEVRDLTAALHDAGRAIRSRETALRAADRAKDEFLAMLGHELRNPLATLSTAADLLRLGRDQPGVLDTAQALIGRQSAHMAHLVDDLLEVGRVTGGKIRLDKAPLDLAAAAARVAATWRAAGRLARHRFRESLDSAWIMADGARIEQIVSNLLDNAVKYTPEGGEIALGVRRQGELALLEVADSGQGLAPELIERVFELFVQGERNLARQQGGLGIGLTLVKRLAELHNGWAEAASEGPGRGATFTVGFPAIPPGERPRAAAPRAAAAPPPERRRVLVVEDNADARESLAMLLRIGGHEVLAAADGAEGLRLAAAARPDIALVDVGLPDLSGYELARRLRESPETAQLRLVALTGYGGEQDRRLALEAGFDQHLVKPVELEELQRLLA
ncbi:MAG TPA: ATP-binding protein [Burkholderiales bacterium]|nr:ATP-binding protein [Burkholderiales bacterium]